MIAVDSSVAIAASGEWHELNGPAAALVAEGVALPAPARLETFSVLTGFPPPHRRAGGSHAGHGGRLGGRDLRGDRVVHRPLIEAAG